MHEDGDRPFEMLAIQDEQPVETLISDGSHKPLRDGIRLRYPNRRAHHFDVLSPKHVVESCRDF
jgi:hypothetical protein